MERRHTKLLREREEQVLVLERRVQAAREHPERADEGQGGEAEQEEDEYLGAVVQQGVDEGGG